MVEGRVGPADLDGMSDEEIDRVLDSLGMEDLEEFEAAVDEELAARGIDPSETAPDEGGYDLFEAKPDELEPGERALTEPRDDAPDMDSDKDEDPMALAREAVREAKDEGSRIKNGGTDRAAAQPRREPKPDKYEKVRQAAAELAGTATQFGVGAGRTARAEAQVPASRRFPSDTSGWGTSTWGTKRTPRRAVGFYTDKQGRTRPITRGSGRSGRYQAARDIARNRRSNWRRSAGTIVVLDGLLSSWADYFYEKGKIPMAEEIELSREEFHQGNPSREAVDIAAIILNASRNKLAMTAGYHGESDTVEDAMDQLRMKHFRDNPSTKIGGELLETQAAIYQGPPAKAIRESMRNPPSFRGEQPLLM